MFSLCSTLLGCAKERDLNQISIGTLHRSEPARCPRTQRGDRDARERFGERASDEAGGAAASPSADQADQADQAEEARGAHRDRWRHSDARRAESDLASVVVEAKLCPREAARTICRLGLPFSGTPTTGSRTRRGRWRVPSVPLCGGEVPKARTKRTPGTARTGDLRPRRATATLAPREEIDMQEDSQNNEQPTISEEPRHSPRGSDGAESEGSIETPGPKTTENDGNPIPPSR